MKLQGGKVRQAAAIARVLRRVNRPCYLEPFVGAGSVLAQVASSFQTVIAADNHEDLIVMHRALQSGWEPPSAVTEWEWRTARHAPPSAYRAYVGYQCSWGGRWFQGYAREGCRGDLDFAAQGVAQTLKNAAAAKGTTYVWADYRAFRPNSDWAVYCDPPYYGTTTLRGKPFDISPFWATMDAWVCAGALVYVSERSAPAGWSPVLTQAKTLALGLDNDKPVQADILFTRTQT